MSGPSARRRPSQQPLPLPGCAGAGCRLQCSKLLAARPWEHRGWSPTAPPGGPSRPPLRQARDMPITMGHMTLSHDSCTASERNK